MFSRSHPLLSVFSDVLHIPIVLFNLALTAALPRPNVVFLFYLVIGVSFDLLSGKVHAHLFPLGIRQAHERIFIGLFLSGPVRVVGYTSRISLMPSEGDEPIPVIVQEIRDVQRMALDDAVSNPSRIPRRPLHLFDGPVIGHGFTVALDASESALKAGKAKFASQVIEGWFFTLRETDREETSETRELCLLNLWVGFVTELDSCPDRLGLENPAVGTGERTKHNGAGINVLNFFILNPWQDAHKRRTYQAIVYPFFLFVPVFGLGPWNIVDCGHLNLHWKKNCIGAVTS